MESYQLRWEVFGDQFLKSLKKESRLQEFADVSVAVSDGEVVQAHKLVLAICILLLVLQEGAEGRSASLSPYLYPWCDDANIESPPEIHVHRGSYHD